MSEDAASPAANRPTRAARSVARAALPRLAPFGDGFGGAPLLLSFEPDHAVLCAVLCSAVRAQPGGGAPDLLNALPADLPARVREDGFFDGALHAALALDVAISPPYTAPHAVMNPASSTRWQCPRARVVAHFGRAAYPVAGDASEKSTASPLTVGHARPTVYPMSNGDTSSAITVNARVRLDKGCKARGLDKGTTAQITEIEPMVADYGHCVRVRFTMLNGFQAGKSFSFFARHINRLSDTFIRMNDGNPNHVIEIRRA